MPGCSLQLLIHQLGKKDITIQYFGAITQAVHIAVGNYGVEAL